MVQLKQARNWIMSIGILLIVAMVSAESLPNAKDGLGPLQASGILVGALIIVSSQLRGSLLAVIGMVLLSIVITLLVLELAVGLFGYEADYTAALIANSQQPLERAPYWSCDTIVGCHFIGDAMPEAMCPGRNPQKTSRFCIINAQGYHDTDEFVPSSQLTQADHTVLVLGDSFTFGMSADYPQSFVDIISENLLTERNTIVWNLGIPGTATRQALVLAKQYVPIMHPDIVVLGFFSNDFNENLYPLDLYENPLIDGKYQLVNAYQLSSNFEPQRLSDANLYFRAHGQPPSNHRWALPLRQTRLGSLLLNALPSLSNITHPDGIWDVSVQQTQDLLQQLQDYLESENVALIVLHIPVFEDIQAPTRTYTAFEQISTDLGLHRLDVLEQLTIDDYQPPPDGHWTNNGHAKAGELLLSCLDFMLENADMICPQAAN